MLNSFLKSRINDAKTLQKEAEEKRKEEEERKANEKSSRADMSFPQKVKSFISLKK